MRTHFNGRFSTTIRYGECMLSKDTRCRREKADKKNADEANFCLKCDKAECNGECAEYQAWYSKNYGRLKNE